MGEYLGDFMKQVIFSQFVQFPPLPIVPELSDPSRFSGPELPQFDISNTANIYITSPIDSTDNSRIGAWYFLPEKSSGRVEPLTEEDTVVLYLHGNSYNRSQKHRVGLYKVLISQGYYVLAIDYRGFGDSSPVCLSEGTVVEDARAALTWISDKLGDRAKVVVWGHSLGSGTCAHAVAEFDMETGGSSTVSAVVLESPFTNMADEIYSFSFLRPLTSMLDINYHLERIGAIFENNKWLPAIKCPVLILHAEDDRIVPFKLGKQLYTEALEAGKENIRFVDFPAAEGRGHCNIYQSETLPDIIKSFLSGEEI